MICTALYDFVLANLICEVQTSTKSYKHLISFYLSCEMLTINHTVVKKIQINAHSSKIDSDSIYFNQHIQACLYLNLNYL